MRSPFEEESVVTAVIPLLLLFYNPRPIFPTLRAFHRTKYGVFVAGLEACFLPRESNRTSSIGAAPPVRGVLCGLTDAL